MPVILHNAVRTFRRSEEITSTVDEPDREVEVLKHLLLGEKMKITMEEAGEKDHFA